MMIPSKPLVYDGRCCAAPPGAGMALPFLEAMRPRRAHGADGGGKRFIAFFYPCGTDPRKWNPPAGRADRDDGLRVPAGSEGLRGRGDLAGRDGAAVRRHGGDRHRSLRASASTSTCRRWRCRRTRATANRLHAAAADAGPVPGRPPAGDDAVPQPRAVGDHQHRHRAGEHLVPHGRAGGQRRRATRASCSTRCSAGMTGTGGATAEERARRRQKSVLDFVLDDANRLNAQAGRRRQAAPRAVPAGRSPRSRSRWSP